MFKKATWAEASTEKACQEKRLTSRYSQRPCWAVADLKRSAKMKDASNSSAPTLQRMATTQLARIVFFEEAMSSDLAAVIRSLRRDHTLSYAEIMWALAESNPDGGQCHTFGKALTEQAYRLLKDGDESWK